MQSNDQSQQFVEQQHDAETGRLERCAAKQAKKFRENMRGFGYTEEQIDEMEREAKEWAKEAYAALRAAYPDGDNHLSGFITPWGATHKTLKTETGEWTTVRSEPVSAEERPRIDRRLAELVAGITQHKK